MLINKISFYWILLSTKDGREKIKIIRNQVQRKIIIKNIKSKMKRRLMMKILTEIWKWMFSSKNTTLDLKKKARNYWQLMVEAYQKILWEGLMKRENYRDKMQKLRKRKKNRRKKKKLRDSELWKDRRLLIN